MVFGQTLTTSLVISTGSANRVPGDWSSSTGWKAAPASRHLDRSGEAAQWRDLLFPHCLGLSGTELIPQTKPAQQAVGGGKERIQ
jgi:hypothetical protein